MIGCGKRFDYTPFHSITSVGPISHTFGSCKSIGKTLVVSHSHEIPTSSLVPVALNDASIVLFSFFVAL